MLEAMSTGLPVLATRHGGIPEAVDEGETGLLCEENDEAALLANLRSITSDSERWKKLGDAAAASIRENFDRERGIEKLEAVYAEALDLAKSND